MATKKPEAEPLRKITVKSVCGDIDLELLMKEKTKAHPLMDVWGVARRAKPGESDYGSYVRFIGEFRAVNIADGTLYKAPALLLPKFLEEELASTLQGDTVNSVEFAFRIAVKYDKDAATKYVYLSETLMEAAESDAIKALEEKIGKRQALLPAPKAK